MVLPSSLSGRYMRYRNDPIQDKQGYAAMRTNSTMASIADSGVPM